MFHLNFFILLTFFLFLFTFSYGCDHLLGFKINQCGYDGEQSTLSFCINSSYVEFYVYPSVDCTGTSTKYGLDSESYPNSFVCNSSNDDCSYAVQTFYSFNESNECNTNQEISNYFVLNVCVNYFVSSYIILGCENGSPYYQNYTDTLNCTGNVEIDYLADCHVSCTTSKKDSKDDYFDKFNSFFGTNFSRTIVYVILGSALLVIIIIIFIISLLCSRSRGDGTGKPTFYDGEMKPGRGWTFDLFTCCLNPLACCCVICCPCCATGEISQKSGGSYLLGCLIACWFPCCYPCCITYRLRKNKEIDGTLFCDCCRFCFCTGCEMARQLREVRDI